MTAIVVFVFIERKNGKNRANISPLRLCKDFCFFVLDMLLIVFYGGELNNEH